MQMNKNILKRILGRYRDEGVFEYLTGSLSNADLNSLLIAVFDERAKKIKPSELLKSYKTNRFVRPVELDYFEFYDYENRLLKLAKEQGFEIKEFSPVTAMGTSSVVGKVDQKNVLTALRNTEVVSDVTNVIALYLADKIKNRRPDFLKVCASHRHIRCQVFDLPGFTAHFKILSLVTGGFDKGDYRFEIDSMIDHINTYQIFLEKALNIAESDLQIELKILVNENRSKLVSVFEKIKTKLQISKVNLVEEAQAENEYYEAFRFKIKLLKNSEAYEIIDGGMVNWIRQLIENKKSRMLISGLGIEYLYRIINRMY